MSRWPVWRTDIAAARAAGLRPHWIGAVAALIVLPLLGVIVLLVAIRIADAVLDAPEIVSTLRELGVFVIFAPVVSWIGLIIGVPLAVLAGRRGYAGWLVAICAGTAIGLVVMVVIGAGSGPLSWLGFAALGAAFAGAYWLAARLFAPAAFRSVSRGHGGS